MIFGTLGSSGSPKKVDVTKPTSYLFVDGNYLLQIANSFCERNLPNKKAIDILDFSKIATDNERSFFFDALPDENHPAYTQKKEQKDKLFNAINLTPNFRVVSGLSRQSGKQKRLRQKGVDTLLAITAYQHAVSGNMDIATIVAGDLDFLPLFDAISTTRVRTKLIFDPSNCSDELVYSADQIQPLTSFFLVKWMNAETNLICGGVSSGSGTPSEFTEIKRGKLNDETVVIGKYLNKEKYVAFLVDSLRYRESLNLEVLESWFYEFRNKELKF